MRDSFHRHDLFELAADYAECSVLVTTSELDLPGPQILYVNSAFTRMTGYAVADLLGKTPRILQGPATSREVLDKLRRSLAEGNDFIGRATNYKRTGEAFELEWIVTPLKNVQGEITHFVAIQRDITNSERAESELKRFDDELREARTQIIEGAERLEIQQKLLREKLQHAQLGEMTSGVMHDLSNALGPVFNLVELLHTMDNLPAEARRITESLDTSVEHAIQVLENLKRYYENPDVPIRKTSNLAQLVRKLPDILSARLWSGDQPSKIKLSVNAKTDVLVRANEVELQQVLVNLLLNAIESVPEGGTVVVDVSEGDELAEISVIDDGPGLSTELMQSCFNPYVTGRSGGIGLGLAVCKRIVESHGGTIKVEDAESQGAAFIVSLPLDVPLVQKTGPNPGKVLVAAGSKPHLARVTERLASLKIDCTGTVGSDAALAELFVEQYDSVLIHGDIGPIGHETMTLAIRQNSPRTRIAWWSDDPGAEAPIARDGMTLPDIAFTLPDDDERLASALQLMLTP